MLKHLVRGRQCLWFSGKDEDDLKVLADSQSCLSLMRQFPNIIIDEAQFFPDIGRVIKEMVENTTTDSRIFVIGSSKLAFGVPLGNPEGIASIHSRSGHWRSKSVPAATVGTTSSATSTTA